MAVVLVVSEHQLLGVDALADVCYVVVLIRSLEHGFEFPDVACGRLVVIVEQVVVIIIVVVCAAAARAECTNQESCAEQHD
ncbi:MAG: hypothetical protein P9M14_05950 [Candidatus Alcyoniella australis]|nr:hypothetical protein [Candidatus Alcyoniella australis]